MSWAPLLLVALVAGPYDVGRFTLDVENDDFGSDRDEAFTSGIRALIRVTPGEGFALSDLDANLKRRRIQEYWGLSFGHEMYTPVDLQATDLAVLSRDRRYAGWLYGALRAEVALDHSPFLARGQSLYRLELSFGSTGPRIRTEALQRYWHAFIRDALGRRRLPEDPKGWSVYQVPNHWGVNLELHQEAEFLRAELRDPGLSRAVAARFGIRAATLAGVRVGNMRIDASAGATIRAGLLPSTVFDEFALPAVLPRSVPVAVYGFVSGRLTAVAYDALLDGPPGAEGPYPDRNPVLTQLEAGFVVRFSVVEFMFRHVTLSPDLAQRPPGGVWIQNWGRFTLSFAFY